MCVFRAEGILEIIIICYFFISFHPFLFHPISCHSLRGSWPLKGRGQRGRNVFQAVVMQVFQGSGTQGSETHRGFLALGRKEFKGKPIYSTSEWFFLLRIFKLYFIDYTVTVVPIFLPLPQHLPLPQAIPTPLFMSMDHAYKFLGYSISYTVHPHGYSVTINL